MIGSILKKDWALLWPLIILVTLIQIALEWAMYAFGFFGSSSLAIELKGLLAPAWTVGIIAIVVAVVHEDPIPGVDQDWLVRPVLRGDLLVAKLLFVLLGVCLPMFVVNVAHEWAMGFPRLPSLGYALYKELYLFLSLLVPVMALATVARSARDLIVLVVGLVVLYVASMWLAALFLGSDRCPTCDTSLSWIQHLLEHIGLLVGSAVVLGVQYYRRETRISRALLAVGVVLLVAVQLPWDVAFAIQSRLATPIGSPPSRIQIVADAAQITQSGSNRARKTEAPGSAARALLHGDVDTALQSIEGQRRPKQASVELDVPLRVSGLASDDYLVIDRASFSLLDARGRVLYSAIGSERDSVLLVPDPAQSGIFHRQFEIPGDAYKQVEGQAVNLAVHLYLTIRTAVARYSIPAQDGEIRSPEIGVCQTSSRPDNAEVRCKQIGHAPNCYAAILYGPDGQHNPEVQSCDSDYRLFLPAGWAILSFNGIDLPIRDIYGVAHYDVDGSDLSNSSIVLKVYEPGQHFRRTVSARIQPPSQRD